jgi:hypothetical protein
MKCEKARLFRPPNRLSPDCIETDGGLTIAGDVTVKIMKTLTLAAFAALSLGAGSAMAITGGDYQSTQVLQALQARSGQVEAGNSDASTAGHWQFGPLHEGETPPYPTVGGDGAGG